MEKPHPAGTVGWRPEGSSVGLGKKNRGPHKGAEHTSQKKQAGLQERDNCGCQKGVWLGGWPLSGLCEVGKEVWNDTVISGTLRGRCHCPPFKDGAHR